MTARRLLVVEDNPANQQLMSALLRKAGCEVALAGSAEEAREVLAGDLPAAILMDIQLPGQDGLALTRELQQDDRTRHVPVIALTAHAMRGDEELALSAGCRGYLSKPIDTHTFTATIDAILNHSDE